MKPKLGLIQVFRGFASILVVLCHLSGSTHTYFNTSFFGDFFLHGYIGVDFFFVLSGFIITYVHFKDIISKSNKRFFLIKRLVRIYPIYWVIVSGYVVLLYLSNKKAKHLDHMLDFSSWNDWIFIAGSYLLIPMKGNPLLGVTWSLTYEILFYLVFLIFIVVGYRSAKLIFIFWLLLIFIKVILSYHYTLPHFMILDERIFEFLCGCTVAYLVLKSYYLNEFIFKFIFLFGMISLYIIYPDMLQKPTGIIILGFFMGIIVYKIVLIDISKEKIYPKILLLLGSASYSIYLSHLILLSILLRVFQSLINKFEVKNFLLIQSLISLMFVFIIAGGVMIFIFIEAPLLRVLNRKFISDSLQR